MSLHYQNKKNTYYDYMRNTTNKPHKGHDELVESPVNNTSTDAQCPLPRGVAPLSVSQITRPGKPRQMSLRETTWVPPQLPKLLQMILSPPHHLLPQHLVNRGPCRSLAPTKIS